MRRFAIAVVAVHSLFLTFAAAQDRPAAASGPTIRATVNEVALDLVVRDKHGKLARNLKPGDVQIYEDGVLQQIRSFRLAEGVTVAEQQSGGTKAATPPAGKISATSPAMELRKANLVCIVLHNQSNLDASMRKFTLEAVLEFLQSHWQPDTWVGVFSLGSGLNVLYPFSTNRNDLIRAAAKGFNAGTFQLSRMADAVLSGTPNMDVLVGQANAAGHSGGVVETLQVGSLNTAAMPDATQTNGLASDAQRGDLVDQQRDFSHIQGSQSIDQVKLMIGQFAALPGHKTVLMLSAGLPSNGNPEQFDALLKKAREADISVYAVDTNGLSQNSNVLAANQAVQYAGSVSQQQANNVNNSSANLNTVTTPTTTTVGTLGREAEVMRQDDYIHNAVRSSNSQAPLRALSEGTGGFLIGGGNDLRKPFQQLIEDVGTHYEAVYRPASDKYDGHLRKIEVKLARADLTVDSRKGYFAVPDFGGVPLMPFEMAGLTVLNANPRPHTFDFRAAAYQFRSEGSMNQVGIAFELPAANITATAETEQKAHRLHVAVVALVKDASGQIVDKFSQDSPFEIPDDKLEVVQNLPITWTHPFDLPPGHYTVETVVLDREGNRVSTSVLPLESPERKGLSLSSVMLVRRVAPVQGEPDEANPFEYTANRVVPLLTPALKPSAQQYVYFVVYPDKASTEQPMIGVEFLVDGKLVAQKTSDLPAPDARGAVPMVMGAMVQPGECELKITAMQGYATATQSVRYTVSAQ
jgi:VWFA-related protein